MKRPERQLKHLLEKISLKESIALKKAGKHTKRWRKAAAKYKAPEQA